MTEGKAVFEVNLQTILYKWKQYKFLGCLKFAFQRCNFCQSPTPATELLKLDCLFIKLIISTHFTKLSAICAVAGSPNHILIARNTGKELTVHHERCCYHEPMFRTVLLIIFGLLWSCLFPLFCQNDIVWQKRFINLIFLSLNH